MGSSVPEHSPSGGNRHVLPRMAKRRRMGAALLIVLIVAPSP
jgi:hypothetical protein